MSVLKDQFSENWLGDDGILYTIVLPDIHLTLEYAKKHVQYVINLGHGKRPPLLVDIRNIHSMSKDARDYFSKDEQSLNSVRAVAVLVASPVSKIIANFFVGLNKPKSMPFQVFTSEEKAARWLKDFLNE